MIQGVPAQTYKVMLGAASCKNMLVYDNLIVCEPPLKRPEVPPAEYDGYNRIPVKVDVYI